jgi:hypothetical protein
VRTQVTQITPSLAREWLNKNTNNIRSVDQSKVDVYAGMMVRNAWPMTHQGIAFDEFGDLIDGQHRLHAIVKSGKTITCLVSFGVHVDAVSVIDRGLRRSSAVVLGEQPRAAEIITFITRLLHSSQFGDDELLQMRDLIGRECNELVAVCGTAKKGITATSIRAAFVTVYLETNDYEVLRNYRRFVLLNVSEPESVTSTPTSLRVLHHRIAESRLRINPIAGFAYAYRALHNLDSKKVSIAEDQIPDFLASIRKFYRKKFNL